MSTHRKRQLPDGAFYVAEANCRPAWNDGHSRYVAASQAYYQLLAAFCPVVAESFTEFTPAAYRSLNRLVPCQKDQGFYPRGTFARIHCATDDQRDALDRLFDFVQKALVEAYEDGRKDGRGLLVSLARGEITAAELDGHKKSEDSDE